MESPLDVSAGGGAAAVTGHGHPDYARALAEFGTPRQLPRCGGWILERQIPGTSHRDAMGCYPLFACQNWSNLKEDLEALGRDLVSLAIAPDPFGDYQLTDLESTFDLVRPFKEHVVVDFHGPWESQIIRHHRRKYRRAFEEMEVRRCDCPQDYIDDWVRLYDHLIATRGIRDMRAFSRQSLSLQLGVPGAALFVAIHKNKVIGGLSLYQQGDVAYAQLTATDELGYELGASYAIHLTAMRYYSDKVRWFNFAGVPGVKGTGGDGLRWFKQGWSKATRPAYFCGRILDRETYQTLSHGQGDEAGAYFPAYRVGEFS